MSNPVIDIYGHKKWYNEQGRLHREDGPAIITPAGTKEWFIDGKNHRENGPAVEWWDGLNWWYINGKRINCNTQEEFELLMKLELFW